MSKAEETVNDFVEWIDGYEGLDEAFKPIIKKRMSVAMQEHTNTTLDILKEKVYKELKELGIPKMVAKKQLHNVMDASTPQQIGEIRTLLNMLDKIDEVKT